MVHIENSLIINKPLPEVFRLSSDFERYPQFLPSVKEVQILERSGDKMTIQRTGVSSGGKELGWKSEVETKENEWIRARQLEGPIPGMLVEWKFSEVPEGTQVVISHDFNYRKIPLIGNLIGRTIVARIVGRMADDTLAAIKKEAEG